MSLGCVVRAFGGSTRTELTWHRNGQLKEYIAGGTSKEEFIRRLSKANESSSRPSQPSSSSVPTPTPVANPAPQNTTTQLSHNDNSLYADVQPAATPASSSSPPPAPSEEEKRLSAEKKGKARAAAGTQPPTAAEQAHANEVKLRRHHVNEERKRILKRIEDDKRARRERDAAERRARTLLGAADLATPASPDAAIALTHQRPMPPRTGAGAGAHCNLQVRLLDGATLRARFPASGTLAADVRAWVDAARTDGDAPYTFRVVLAPQPNRALAAREEAESLASLGLAPSATLVLVPAAHSVAYARAGGVLAPVLGVVSSLCGAVMASIGGLFALFFGGGGGGGGGGGERPPGARRDDVPMENLRSRRGDAQLYNGNSVCLSVRPTWLVHFPSSFLPWFYGTELISPSLISNRAMRTRMRTHGRDSVHHDGQRGLGHRGYVFFIAPLFSFVAAMGLGVDYNRACLLGATSTCVEIRSPFISYLYFRRLDRGEDDFLKPIQPAITFRCSHYMLLASIQIFTLFVQTIGEQKGGRGEIGSS